MEPLFFGPSTSSLYGVYHPPNGGSFSNRAVVLCYPAGHEYMRIHRAYRQLASQLNEWGCHVLRFDFFGTGDSSGEHQEITFSRWVDDLRDAIEELQALSGVRQIDVVGLRMSTLVAARVASESKSIRRLVLWEPFLSGKEFIDEILHDVNLTPDSLSNFTDPSGAIHFNGYCFAPDTIKSFIAGTLEKLQWSNKPKVMCLSARNEDASLGAVDRYFQDEEIEYQKHFVPGLTNWNALDAIGGLFLPTQAVNALNDWLRSN